MPMEKTLQQAAELLENIRKLTTKLRERLECYYQGNSKCGQKQSTDTQPASGK